MLKLLSKRFLDFSSEPTRATILTTNGLHGYLYRDASMDDRSSVTAASVSPQFKELPVLRTTLRALTSPFRYPFEFVRFGAIPLLLTMLAFAIEGVISHFGAISLDHWFTSFSICAINVPFALRWTKIEVEGRSSVAGLPAYGYGRPELTYGMASAVMLLVTVGPLIVAWDALASARQRGDNASQTLVAFLALAFMIVGALVALRFSFLFPK